MKALFRQKWFIILVIVVIAGILAWKVLKPASIPPGFATGNGRLEAIETNVAAKYAGRLDKVLVREGDTVAKGQEVAQMDVEELRAQLRAAEASLAQAEQAALESRSNAASAISQQKLAQVTYKRTKDLVAENFVSKAQLDRDSTGLQTANASVAAAGQRVKQSDAMVAEAKARVSQLSTTVNDTTLFSPVDGRILYRLAEPGEVLAAGGRVLTIIDLSDVYMSIYLSADDAGKVLINSDARIVLDSMPDTPIPAKVVFVSPRSQFTPKEVETKYEREKLMFRVKVQVNPDWIAKNANIAKPGMPGVAWVKTNADATWPSQLEPK